MHRPYRYACVYAYIWPVGRGGKKKGCGAAPPHAPQNETPSAAKRNLDAATPQRRTLISNPNVNKIRRSLTLTR